MKFGPVATAFIAATCAIGVSSSAKADGPVMDYPFSATAFIAGGGAWIDNSGGFLDGTSTDLATIVSGGDIVLPVSGGWNIQLGGAFLIDYVDAPPLFGSGGNVQFQGGALAFWRDANMGLFGLEAGLFSPFEGFTKYVKLGGAAEYYFGDTATISGFGGVLIPVDGVQPDGLDPETGFYAGGHLTYYAGSNYAFSINAGYMNVSRSNAIVEAEFDQLRIGGKFRYLTEMPGVELFAAGGYVSCDPSSTGPLIQIVDEADGAEVLAGIQIHLGGIGGSLVSIDRSSPVDTRAWTGPNC